MVTRSFNGTLNVVLGTVCRLNTGTVFALSNVDVCVWVLATVDRLFDVDLGNGRLVLVEEVSAVGREFDVDVSVGVFGGGSALSYVDILALARSVQQVVMVVLVPVDMDLLLDLVLLLSGWETGREGFDFVLPSDAMMCR